MKSTITFVLGVVVVGTAIGFAGARVLDLSPKATRLSQVPNRVARAQRAQFHPKPQSTKDWCQVHMSPDGITHVFDTYCPPAKVAEARKAERSMLAAVDFFATGSKTASAEWRSLKQDGITCGITPTGSYIIVQNAIGKTRYNDPPGNDWGRLGCHETEPARQQQILDAAAEHEAKDYVFKATHHLDEDCQMREMKEMVDRRKVDADTCWRDGSSEQAMAERLARHDNWQGCQNQQVAAAQAAGNYDTLDAKVVEEACGKEPE